MYAIVDGPTPMHAWSALWNAKNKVEMKPGGRLCSENMGGDGRGK